MKRFISAAMALAMRRSRRFAFAAIAIAATALLLVPMASASAQTTTLTTTTTVPVTSPAQQVSTEKSVEATTQAPALSSTTTETTTQAPASSSSEATTTEPTSSVNVQTTTEASAPVETTQRQVTTTEAPVSTSTQPSSASLGSATVTASCVNGGAGRITVSYTNPTNGRLQFAFFGSKVTLITGFADPNGTGTASTVNPVADGTYDISVAAANNFVFNTNVTVACGSTSTTTPPSTGMGTVELLPNECTKGQKLQLRLHYEGTDQGTFQVSGYTYPGGFGVSDQTLSGGATLDVTLPMQPGDAYSITVTLPDGTQMPFSGTFRCDVMPTPPTFTDLDGTENDTYIINPTKGVVYTVDGNPVTGINPGEGTVTVVATAEPGYVITGENTFSFTFTGSTTTTPTTPPVTTTTAPPSTTTTTSPISTTTVPPTTTTSPPVTTTTTTVQPSTTTVTTTQPISSSPTATSTSSAGPAPSTSGSPTPSGGAVVPPASGPPAPPAQQSPAPAGPPVLGAPAPMQSGDSGLNPGFGAKTSWDEHRSGNTTSWTSALALILLGSAAAGALYATRKRGART